MMAVGEPVYNTEQRREILRQMKQYFDEEWLKRKAAGKLRKNKIRLPNSKKRKPKTKIKRKRKKYNKFKIKIVKIKGKKKNGWYFK